MDYKFFQFVQTQKINSHKILKNEKLDFHCLEIMLQIYLEELVLHCLKQDNFQRLKHFIFQQPPEDCKYENGIRVQQNDFFNSSSGYQINLEIDQQGNCTVQWNFWTNVWEHFLPICFPLPKLILTSEWWRNFIHYNRVGFKINLPQIYRYFKKHIEQEIQLATAVNKQLINWQSCLLSIQGYLMFLKKLDWNSKNVFIGNWTDFDGKISDFSSLNPEQQKLDFSKLLKTNAFTVIDLNNQLLLNFQFTSQQQFALLNITDWHLNSQQSVYDLVVRYTVPETVLTNISDFQAVINTIINTNETELNAFFQTNAQKFPIMQIPQTCQLTLKWNFQPLIQQVKIWQELFFRKLQSTALSQQQSQQNCLIKWIRPDYWITWLNFFDPEWLNHSFNYQKGKQLCQYQKANLIKVTLIAFFRHQGGSNKNNFFQERLFLNQKINWEQTLGDFLMLPIFQNPKKFLNFLYAGKINLPKLVQDQIWQIQFDNGLIITNFMEIGRTTVNFQFRQLITWLNQWNKNI